VALCLLFPLRTGLVEDSRRCDSARSRWRAMSFLRFAASEGSSSAIVAPSLSRITAGAAELLGTLEL
jgi:hypothetical protein